MVRRRNKLEIYVDILYAIKDREEYFVKNGKDIAATKPTQIMYGSNLSWYSVMSKLELLKKRGLVEEIEHIDNRTTKMYRLTEDGEEMRLRYRRKKNNKKGQIYKELDSILGTSLEKIKE